ncbi:MAG TPA: hypothetical protein V6C82_02815, partial [Chroococcales cyanobacterium]
GNFTRYSYSDGTHEDVPNGRSPGTEKLPGKRASGERYTTRYETYQEPGVGNVRYKIVTDSKGNVVNREKMGMAPNQPPKPKTNSAMELMEKLKDGDQPKADPEIAAWKAEILRKRGLKK